MLLAQKGGAGNSKLGRDVFSFSLPPVVTCPGRTDWCAANCYAGRRQKSRFNYPSVKSYLARVYREAQGFDFAGRMVGECMQKKMIRIHAAGDFFSEDYIWAWNRIVRNCPDTSFACYTRAWSVPGLVDALEMLRGLPNIHSFASVDPGVEGPAGWRWAMVVDDWSEAPHDAVRCPNQFSPKHPTCSTCKICWRPAGKKPHVAFLKH